MLKLSQDDKRFIRNILLMVLAAFFVAVPLFYLISAVDMRQPVPPPVPVFSNCAPAINSSIQKIHRSGINGGHYGLLVNIDSPEVAGYICRLYSYDLRFKAYSARKSVLDILWREALELRFANIKQIREHSKWDMAYINKVHFNMLLNFKSPEACDRIFEMRNNLPDNEDRNPFEFYCTPKDSKKFRRFIEQKMRTPVKRTFSVPSRGPSTYYYLTPFVWRNILMYSYLGTEESASLARDALTRFPREACYVPEIMLNSFSLDEIIKLAGDPIRYGWAMTALGMSGADEAVEYLTKESRSVDSRRRVCAVNSLVASGAFIDEQILRESGLSGFSDHTFLNRCIDEDAAPANIPAEKRAEILLDVYKIRKSAGRAGSVFDQYGISYMFGEKNRMNVSAPVLNALLEIWRDDPEHNRFMAQILIRHGFAEILKHGFSNRYPTDNIRFNDLKAAIESKPSAEFIKVLKENQNKVSGDHRSVIKAMLGDFSELKTKSLYSGSDNAAEILYRVVLGDASEHEKVMREVLSSSMITNTFRMYASWTRSLSLDELKRIPKLSPEEVENITVKLIGAQALFYNYNKDGLSPLPAFLYWNECYGELLNIAYDRTMPYDLRGDSVYYLAGVDNAEIVEKLAALAESAAREEETKYLRSTRLAVQCFSSLSETYEGIADRSDPRCARIRKAIASALSEGDMYLKPKLSEMLKNDAYGICDQYMVETLSGAAEKEKNLLIRGNLLNAVRMMKNRMQHLEPSPSKTSP